MNKNSIKYKNWEIEFYESESTSKDLILFLHGLDGSAEFAKPLFKTLGEEFKIVAIQQRGHHNSHIPSSRLISTHIEDVLFVVKHFKEKGFKVWLMGESMGAGLAANIAYKSKEVEGVFAQSIPNRIVNLQEAPKKDQFSVGLKTFVSYLTNIDFKHKQMINYEMMSNNRAMIRLAKLADKTKLTSTRERLMTWALTKRTWRLFKSKKVPLVPLIYFSPDQDPFCNVGDTIRALGKKENPKLVMIKDSKHILMYEANYDQVYDYIREFIKGAN